MNGTMMTASVAALVDHETDSSTWDSMEFGFVGSALSSIGASGDMFIILGQMGSIRTIGNVSTMPSANSVGEGPAFPVLHFPLFFQP